mmetsp:Transcript_56139/g.174491  ORF Transcript_56139/g.174491 Transcript_56139/m.174491 type:complete len:209 (+) Transcript_56139:459-1085(+)
MRRPEVGSSQASRGPNMPERSPSSQACLFEGLYWLARHHLKVWGLQAYGFFPDSPQAPQAALPLACPQAAVGSQWPPVMSGPHSAPAPYGKPLADSNFSWMWKGNVGGGELSTTSPQTAEIRAVSMLSPPVPKSTPTDSRAKVIVPSAPAPNEVETVATPALAFSRTASQTAAAMSRSTSEPSCAASRSAAMASSSVLEPASLTSRTV